MQPIEAASPQEHTQLHRETRIENRAYAHAQERATADPYICTAASAGTPPRPFRWRGGGQIAAAASGG